MIVPTYDSGYNNAAMPSYFFRLLVVVSLKMITFADRKSKTQQD